MTNEAEKPRTHLDLDTVSLRFGSVKALDKISLSLAHGEIVCLVGHSGCGKSTLLRVIAGIVRPDEGRVLLDGAEISGPKRYVEPEERNIGFMFQDYALFPHLDVTGNILFGLNRLGRDAAQKRCAEILARLGLQPLADRFPHMLSGGEQQRVALARALAPRPAILLMDEPFSNLDRGLRGSIRAETLALLRELKTTVIMVTHDPEEALSSGDRVALMRSGTIVQVGTGADLYDRPSSSIAAEFFCSFNTFESACRNGYADTPLGRFKTPGFADGERVTIYVRPQSLRIGSGDAGIDCTVVGCALMGEIEELSLSTDALPKILTLRSTERRQFRAGDKLRVSVSPEHVLVF